MAIAPALTIGFVRPSALRSTAASELNGRPVPLTPTRSRSVSGPSSSHTSANTNGLDTLMIVNSWSTSPALNTRPLVPTRQMPKRSGGTSASAG